MRTGWRVRASGLLALPIALAPFGVVLALAMVVLVGVVSTMALTGLVAIAMGRAGLTISLALADLVTERLPHPGTTAGRRPGQELATGP